MQEKQPIEITIELVQANAKGQMKKYAGSKNLDEKFIFDQAMDTLQIIRFLRSLMEKDEQRRRALSSAWTDIQQWIQLANNHRESLDRPDHTPYCPSVGGVQMSKQILQEITDALAP